MNHAANSSYAAIFPSRGDLALDDLLNLGRGPLEEYRLELGLYTLGAAGEARWRPTPLVEQFRSYVSDPEGAIGPLAGAAAGP